MDAALEAVEDAFHAVFVAIAQHCCLQREPRGLCIGYKSLPAKTLAQGSDAVSLACDLGDVVAQFLNYPLLTVRSATPSAHILCGLLDLFFPGHAEQPVYAMRCQHMVNRLLELCFVSDLPFTPPSGGRQGRQLGLGMTQTCFQPRGLLGSLYGRAHDQHPFAPCLHAAQGTTGPLQLIALGRQHLVPSVIGTPYLG